MKPFEQFLRERKYLQNVSPRTVEFYEDCRRSVEKFLSDHPNPAIDDHFKTGQREMS